MNDAGKTAFTPRWYGWLVVLVLLLASVSAPLNQFKVPPLMPLLMGDFNLSVGEAGSLMSVFAVTGLILALPAGFVFQKLGYRLTGLLAVGAVAAGAALGAVSNDIATMWLSRIVEGTGTSLLAVVAPAVVALWFVADKRGMPLGVWATWVPLGQAIVFVAAPLLVVHGGWRTVWWFGCIYAVCSGLLYFIFVRPMPATGQTAAEPPLPALSARDLVRVLRIPDLWLISLTFACFNAAFIGFITWAPTYLETVYALPLGYSATFISISTFVSMFVIPFSGWFSDRIGSRKWICVVPLGVMGLSWVLLCLDRPWAVLLVILAVGFSGRFVPTGVFAAGAEVVGDSRLSGMAMAVIQVGQNAGMLLGPLGLGWLIEKTGSWLVAFLWLIPVCIVGAVAVWRTKVR